MATNVQRGGLGFEKFFRRRSSSPEASKDSEKNPNTNEDADPSKEANESGLSKFGKIFGQKTTEDKNDVPKSASTKDLDEVSSQKTEGSKKSSKTKKPPVSTKQEDKRKESEACKELIIKDDQVGQVKLSDIINNSIKEAVLNIVKEGVCPLADSLDRTKEPSKKPSSSVGQEIQDKENKPGSPKHLASLLSGANKTFDSHQCRSQYQPSISSRSPSKSGTNDRPNANQCTRELCPRVSKDRRAKSSKQKDKSPREVSPKITRLAKGSSHFRSDNRRMTGNVNIYICSEANDNAKDKKQKEKDRCNDDSETTSDTKTSTSSLSVSTSKLVAALRKKQRKNPNDPSLSCLCDIPESPGKQYRNTGKIGEDVDDVSCLCDDGSGNADFLDTRSSSSRDCVCEDEKFSDLDFGPGSDLVSLDQACTLQDCEVISQSASEQYTSYDNNNFWPCSIEDCPIYKDDYREKRLERRQSNAKKDLEERCSCCNLKRCRKERPKTVPCRQEPQERSGRRQFDRCPCIVEEEDEEDCCVDAKKPKEMFTVCGNSESKEETLCNRESKSKPDETPSESESGILRRSTEPVSPKNGKTLRITSPSSEQIIDNKDESNVTDEVAKPAKPVSSKTGLFSNVKKNRKNPTDRESKTISGETTKVDGMENSRVEEPGETAEDLKEDQANESTIADAKQKNSFFYRSIKRAMGMVTARKDDDATANRGNTKRGCSAKCTTKPNLNGENGDSSAGTGDCGPTCSGIGNEKTASSVVENEKIISSGKQKGKSTSSVIGNGKTTFSGNENEKATVNEKQKGKSTSSGNPKGKTISSGIGNGKTTSSGIGNRKTTSSGIETGTITSSGIGNGKTTSSGIGNKKTTSSGIETGTITSSVNQRGKSTSDGTSSPEKRSRSRISTAIASRRSSAATTNDSSNLSIPQGPFQAEASRSPTNLSTSPNLKKPIDSRDCECRKLIENCDRCCKKMEPPKDESCKCCAKCRNVASSSGVCCKKMETPKPKPCACCPKCGNPVDCCICCRRKPEQTIEDQCTCCPRCRRPMTECKCCSVEPEEMNEEFCTCCRKSKRLCCCEKEPRAKKSQPKKCRQPSDFNDNNNRRCSICCEPKAECRCNQRCPKSMICIYCDNPQEDCMCRAPIRKCSQCALPVDVCNCKPAECCDCNGRLIVPTESNNNEQTICVSAWKPRRSVRRYFAREADDGNFEEDCPCYNKSKPYGSDGLPYQKRGVFSTVMSELQQKMSGSVCCSVCRKVPCCCCCPMNERQTDEKIERKSRVSTTLERRIPCPSQERSRSKSPAKSCRCTPNAQRKRGRKSSSKICNRCRKSPCRCRRSSASPREKPQAKCYYCKNSPCICSPANEPSNARKFRSADSSHYRRTERSSLEKKINVDNDDNEYRGRVVVPTSGNQQIRKYCYRENSTKQQHPMQSGERVR